MPRVIPIDKIEDGMVLSEPIINNFGQTLIPAGAHLSDRHTKILKTWNIYSVTIKSDESEDEIELTDELKQLAEEHLSKRILWKPRNAIETDLYMMGIIHTAKKHIRRGQFRDTNR